MSGSREGCRRMGKMGELVRQSIRVRAHTFASWTHDANVCYSRGGEYSPFTISSQPECGSCVCHAHARVYMRRRCVTVTVFGITQAWS